MRPPVRLCLALLPVLVLAGACASGSNRPRGGPSGDWITHEELAEVQGVRNMYDVVQRLRPRWLIARGSDGSAPVEAAGRLEFGGDVRFKEGIVVYQDQTFLGGVGILNQIQPGMYYALRWLPGSVASATLPGLHPDHPVAGAIVLYTNERGGR